jgi:division protein CdvB (Snf7/Vps24/ESCRT-III family)
VVDVKSDIHPTKLRCKLQAASCKLQAASCKLQAASCKLQAASCKLQANQRGCSTPLLLGFFLPLVACGL